MTNQQLADELEYWLGVIGDRIGRDRRFSDTAKDAIAVLRPATTDSAQRLAVLEQAKAALIKIRACSIAGCEEGYGKPEKWADALLASHADVAAAIKSIDATLRSSALPETAPTDRELHDCIAAALQQQGTTYSGIQLAVREIQKLYARPSPDGAVRFHRTTEVSDAPIGQQKAEDDAT